MILTGRNHSFPVKVVGCIQNNGPTVETIAKFVTEDSGLYAQRIWNQMIWPSPHLG